MWESGNGTRALRWELEGGERSLVVMNEDGSQGIDFDIKVGAERTSVLVLGIGTIIGGVVLLGLGVFMIIVAVRGRKSSGGGTVSVSEVAEDAS